jgi:hypothetical protein
MKSGGGGGDESNLVKFVDIKVFFVENVKILKPSLIF